MKPKISFLSKLSSIILLTFSFLLFTFNSFAQGVSISSTGNDPDASAILDVSSTETPFQGLLIPRLTTEQRNLISSPVESLLIYNTTTQCYEGYNANTTTWISFGCIGCIVPSEVTATASSNSICAGSSLTLTGGATDATSWSWTGPNSFSSSLQSPIITNITTDGTGIYTLAASNDCGSVTASTVLVTVSTAAPTEVTATADVNPICAGSDLVLTGGATDATSWSWSGNGNTYTVQSPTITSITTAGAGVYTLTASNGCGSVTANTASIIVNAAPTTADAGTDIILACGVATATLAGNTPEEGAGVWSVVSGTATITTPSSPISVVTGLAVSGEATLRWTISNALCTASIDDVKITTCFSCGNSLTISHVAGDVAPVNKTVTYGTVEFSDKCWITRNLGATHQATSATDNTEESAGWYWQFNCKRGYKATSTTVIAPTWNTTSVNGDSDWLPANDPCAIELGTDWRIPTEAEWINADTGWATGADAYNSVLKLHLAGTLNANKLYSRGTLGDYWSSTQENDDNGLLLRFDSASSAMRYFTKAHGFSVRCLKD